jgi:hypothetical protein
MKRFSPIAAVYLAALGVLISVSHYPALGWVLDHFALLAAVYVGFRWNKAVGICFGLLLGLSAVFLDGGPVNLGLMVIVVAGWLAATSHDHMGVSSMPVQLVLTFLIIAVASVVHPLLYAGQWPAGGIIRFMTTMAGAIVLTGVLFPFGDRVLDPPRSARARPLEMQQRL